MIQLGILGNRTAQRLAYWFERRCYRAASLIVTLSPDMSRWIEERYGFTNTATVPNACDNELFGNPKHDGALPDWTDGIHYALYTGNIGGANNSELLVRAAQVLQERQIKDLHLVLIGDGPQKALLKVEAAQKRLQNIHFLNQIPKTQLVRWVRQALCSVVPLKGVPILDASSPNKLFDSLAAGVPVIQTTQGWIKDLLAKEGCGLTINADAADALVNALMMLKNQPQLRRSMGDNARQVSVGVFDRTVLARKMIEAIEAVCQRSSATVSTQ
jgi:glycosyltransferase involved in cell wall biosynthesis